MAKRGAKDRHRFLAKLVTENRAPCAFCQREVDEETTYGKLYAIGDIQCHYFCVLLSCCLVQKGKDEEGLFGFLYQDILAELERSKKHRCSFCGKEGATLGCAISQCRKQFHLPCGRERNAVSLFYANYKSFCQLHAPKQKIPDVIMSKARVRMQEKKRMLKGNQQQLDVPSKAVDSIDSLKTECVCVICYEEVDAFPTLQTFWPPCCARDAWFHRSCLQRMALSAGMHYLKCPLCNDKENFYQAVVSQGYYVPDRDAAWELEQNAYADIYERRFVCNVDKCECPLGRNYDSEAGIWDIKLCLFCGSLGAHAHCLSVLGCAISDDRYICTVCETAAPKDVEELARSLERVVAMEQSRQTSRQHGPRMPSRMSLRLTKQSNSASRTSQTNAAGTVTITNTVASRQDLNLRAPRKQIKSEKPELLKQVDNTLLSPVKLFERTQKMRKLRPLSVKKETVGASSTSQTNAAGTVTITNTVASRRDLNLRAPRKQIKSKKPELLRKLEQVENTLMSPVKLFEQTLKERTRKMGAKGTENVVLDEKVVARLRQMMRKPRPLSVKKKIVESLLDELLKNMDKENWKVKEPVKGWSLKQPPETRKCQTEVPAPASHDTSEDDVIILTEEARTIDLNDVTTDTVVPSPSRDILPIYDTPTKTKTVEIQKDSSMEISEGNAVTNIDLVKIENAEKKEDFIRELDLTTPDEKESCLLKFSPKEEEKASIDIESVKSQNLNECQTEVPVPASHDTSEDDVIILTEEARTIDFNDVTTDAVVPSPSRDILPIFDTPKKTKTVEIQKDSSMEISEGNEVVNINLVKIENAEKKDFMRKLDLTSPDEKEQCVLKFSPKEKEKVRIDIESFKSQHLNEVGRDFNCKFSHKHETKTETPKLRTAIEFALDAAAKENRKLKLKRKKSASKKRKLSELVLQYVSENGEKKKKRNNRKKLKTSLSITNDNMEVKISLKKERFRLKIMQSKNENIQRNLKQYVLKYSAGSTKDVIEKPEEDVTPIKRKRKYVKLEKSPDNFKQTSLHSFFKTKSPNTP